MSRKCYQNRNVVSNLVKKKVIHNHRIKNAPNSAPNNNSRQTFTFISTFSALIKFISIFILFCTEDETAVLVPA